MDLGHLGSIGERLAIARNPGLIRIIMVGLARMTAIAGPSSLMETASQLSYPLNSENASPPGTFALYLSWDVSTDAATTTIENARAAQPLNAPEYCSVESMLNSSCRKD